MAQESPIWATNDESEGGIQFGKGQEKIEEVADNIEAFKMSIWVKRFGRKIKELEIKKKILKVANIRIGRWRKLWETDKPREWHTMIHSEGVFDVLPIW